MELFSYNVVVIGGFKQQSAGRTEWNSSGSVVVTGGFKQQSAGHTEWNSSGTVLWL
jgi:hypothetical protein